MNKWRFIHGEDIYLPMYLYRSWDGAADHFESNSSASAMETRIKKADSSILSLPNSSHAILCRRPAIIGLTIPASDGLLLAADTELDVELVIGGGYAKRIYQFPKALFLVKRFFPD